LDLKKKISKKKANLLRKKGGTLILQKERRKVPFFSQQNLDPLLKPSTGKGKKEKRRFPPPASRITKGKGEVGPISSSQGGKKKKKPSRGWDVTARSSEEKKKSSLRQGRKGKTRFVRLNVVQRKRNLVNYEKKKRGTYKTTKVKKNFQPGGNLNRKHSNGQGEWCINTKRRQGGLSKRGRRSPYLEGGEPLTVPTNGGEKRMSPHTENASLGEGRINLGGTDYPKGTPFSLGRGGRY